MTGSAISPAAVESIAAAIFSESAPVELEAYSDFGEDLQRVGSPQDLLSYVAAKRAVQGNLVYLSVWYPEMLGSMEVTHIALNPAKCNGHSFRYSTGGWGVISVQLRLIGGESIQSCISANSQARAEKWAPTYPELGSPSLWAWLEVARHTRRLNRVLRKAA